MKYDFVTWRPTWGSKISDNQPNYSRIVMAEKLEHLKLKRRGQRGVVTKLHQEANSLLKADSIESSALRRLRTMQGILRENQAELKMLDEEITDMCPINEVENKTMEAEKNYNGMYQPYK